MADTHVHSHAVFIHVFVLINYYAMSMGIVYTDFVLTYHTLLQMQLSACLFLTQLGSLYQDDHTFCLPLMFVGAYNL